MGSQGIVGHQLICNLNRKLSAKTSGDVEARQLVPLGFRRVCKFATLPSKISMLGVRLGANRDVLTGCHRKGAGCEPRDCCQQDRRAARIGSSYTHNQAARRNKTIVGTKDGGAQPADPIAAVQLMVHGLPLYRVPFECRTG
jgi:hypothetical protein